MTTLNFNVDNCKKAVLAHNNRLKDKWYGMNTTTDFGSVAFLYKKYGYPSTYEKFYEMYINDHKDFSRENGRSYQYLVTKANELREIDNNQCGINVYFDYMMQKLLVDTFNGLAKEGEVKKMLEESGFTTNTPSLDEDRKLGIDLKVFNEDGLMCLIQVKPNTFFIGNRNETLINDRKSAIEKEKLATSIYNVPTFFIIYKKDDGEFIQRNGKYCFKLNNLINEDGTTKNNI